MSASSPAALMTHISPARKRKDAIMRGACEVVQPDPIKAGGLLNCQKVAHLAEAFSKAFTPHDTSVNLGMAATLQLVASVPNARGPLIVDACLRLGYVTITIALLGYLSLGLPPPFPDWGKMISGAQKFGSFGMNAMLWPAFAISSLVLGLSLLADGLEEVSKRMQGRAA